MYPGFLFKNKRMSRATGCGFQRFKNRHDPLAVRIAQEFCRYSSMKKTVVRYELMNPSERALWDAIRNFLEHALGARPTSKVPQK